MLVLFYILQSSLVNTPQSRHGVKSGTPFPPFSLVVEPPWTHWQVNITLQFSPHVARPAFTAFVQVLLSYISIFYADKTEDK